MPSRLWRLEPHEALRTYAPGPELLWSGSRTVFDLAMRSDRLQAYELVIREGRPTDIESVVDGVLLCELWPDLVVPRDARSAWAALAGRAHPELAIAF